MGETCINPIIRSLFIYLSLYHYLRNCKTAGQSTDTVQESSTFTCEDGKTIDVIDVCDGRSDCEDGTDENCENEGILFFYTLDVYCERVYNYNEDYVEQDPSDHIYKKCSTPFKSQWDKLNVTGILLNHHKEFSMKVVTPEVIGTSNFISDRLEIYLIKSEKKNISSFERISRYGNTTAISGQYHDVRETPMIDWLASKIFFLSGSQILTCDKNFSDCVSFNSQFVKNPILLAISVRYRLLFWIDKISQSEYHLISGTLNGNSDPTSLLQDLKIPKWLTIDPIKNRIYWLDNRDGVLKFHSSTFEGTDVKILSPGISIIDDELSFAIFNDSIFWVDIKEENTIMKCSINDCNTPSILKKVSAGYHDPKIISILSTIVFSLTIDYRSLTPSNIREPCNRMCSHTCLPDLPTSENRYRCYCRNLNESLPANMSNGYCKDDTLIAAYQNSLYIVGLPKESADRPRIHKNTLNTINSISALTYNSIDGSVFLTEIGKQRIHSWIPRTGELKLVLDDGVGTINSIEYDNHANNLYWIDNCIFAVKVMNMHSHIKGIILEGNSSYAPIQFTLVPARGYMAILFLKENSIVIIERISMDGGDYSRKILFEDHKTDNKKNYSLHYMRETRCICLLDKQTNKIKYFPDEISGFLTTSDIEEGDIKSITSLKNYVFWSKDDLTIYRAPVDTTFSIINSTQKISLGIKKTNSSLEVSENNFVKITNVESQITEPHFSRCLRNNAGCEKLCLTSNRHQRYTCFCPDGERLIDGTSCRILFPLENSTVAKSEKSQLEKNSVKFDSNEMKSSTENTATIVITSPVQETKPCFEKISPSNSTSLQNIFYFVLISILGTSFCFMAGYFLRGRWSEHCELRLFPESGTLELSRMTSAESVSTLPLIRTS